MVKRKTLSTLMAEELSEKVLNGTLKPGARLPTEAELCDEYEVSRTVVREAIARLRSDGLLISQQGRGMFVSEHPQARKFEIDPQSLITLPETISALELRLSVEVEAASLCAQRRTKADAKKIRSLMEKVDALQSDPTKVEIHYDFAFHLAIAQATKNPLFYRFLKFLEPTIVPRYLLSNLVSSEIKDRYYRRIHGEHEAIVSAIECKNGDDARKAMRTHLENSLERIRALSRSVGIKDGLVADDKILIKFMKIGQELNSVS